MGSDTKEIDWTWSTIKVNNRNHIYGSVGKALDTKPDDLSLMPQDEN